MKFENAATNFSNPTRAIVIALDSERISSNQHLLELGGGNLRNALYVLRTLANVKYDVVEIAGVISRFKGNYLELERLGEQVFEEMKGECLYDAAICTFVLETICPSSKRLSILHSCTRAIKKGGILIASFRGYPGVKGTKYQPCLAGEGFITPLKTFIKPFSIPEVKDVLEEAGYNEFETLQKYRTESPQNIHIIARKG
jgi:hypothetical protein